MNNDYWKKWYESNGDTYPTQFAELCSDIINEDDKVLEFGCGNVARDRKQLTKSGCEYKGVDICAPDDQVQMEVEGYMTMTKDEDSTVLYSRFFLHAIEEKLVDYIIEWAIEHEMKFLAEFRTDMTDAPDDTHTRNLVHGSELLKKLINAGYDIVYYVEARGLARYGDEDPVIGRVIATPCPNSES